VQLFYYYSDSDLPLKASLPAGNPIQSIPAFHIRFLFGNIHGFHIGDDGSRFRQICREIRTLEVDHAGFEEINSIIQLLKVKRILHETTKREFFSLCHVFLYHFHWPMLSILVQDDLVKNRLLVKGSDPLGRWS
jgi:hypothetical protein